MKYFKLLPLLLLLAFSQKVFSQISLEKMKGKFDLQNQQQNVGIKTIINSKTQAGIYLKNIGLPENQSGKWLKDQLELRDGIDTLLEERVHNLKDGFTVRRLHQYYKGIKVEHGVVNTTSHNGIVNMVQMEAYSIPADFNTKPTISETAALKKATEYLNADKYAWDGYSGNDTDYTKPKGELVIVRTYKDDSSICLAYKFNIFTLQPFSRAYIYVNAWDGTVVLKDLIIKHAGEVSNIPYHNSYEQTKTASSYNIIPLLSAINPEKNNVNLSMPTSVANGTAATRYNGTQSIVTDSGSSVPGKPFRLREVRNGIQITTLNYQQRPANTAANNDPLAIDFVDNDNNWTDSEFNNAARDNAALDAHFNMQIISDFWLNVFNRNSWDNKGSTIINNVHVTEAQWNANGVYQGTFYMNNAFWNGTKMYYGDGNNTATYQPLTPLDICGHELGHAVTQTTSGLVYQWESGALNEGFSDIWGACITNYAKVNYPSLSTEITWRMGEKCWGVGTANPGLRDLSNPHLYNQPSAYKDSSWVPSTYLSCPVLTSNNDECGVHQNSGVLNKWFFLITQGETATNSLGKAYSITGLGFDTSQKIAYLTSLNLPPNSSFSTAETVSLNATAALYGVGSNPYNTVQAAWVAVGVDSNIYNMSNTPVFATNTFTSVAIGTNGYIWAGTNYKGLYEYNDTAWLLRPEIPNVRINDIKADKNGGIWVAQSGTQSGGASAIAGGVNYLPYPYTTNNFYTVDEETHIPSRNARCIFIDTSHTNDVSNNPKVWVATLNYINDQGNSATGMLGQGLYSSYPEFQGVSGGINTSSGTNGCLTVGGNKSVIWTFVQANNGINQLLTYDALADTLLKTYDHTSVPIIPSGFIARAIYTDARNRTWIGLETNAIMVFDERKNWHYESFANVFPSGSEVNANAITGDKKGNIYIGTTSGLIFFDHGIGGIGAIDSAQNYKLFNSMNGLPSSNINAIAYDTMRFKVIVATDSGIVFWEPLCLGSGCKVYTADASKEAESVNSGLWSNPGTWSDGQVPDSSTEVTIFDSVTVDINAQCNSLNIEPAGYVNVKNGINLTIYSPNSNIIMGSQSQQAQPANKQQEY